MHDRGLFEYARARHARQVPAVAPGLSTLLRTVI
jgi:hypothetical protein